MMQRSRLFGTDGIRGKAGQFPFDRESLVKIGQTIGKLAAGSKIIIGRDTRESGEEIAGLLSYGISGRAAVFSCGVFSTPGVSYITGHSDFDYGIMITASHNPYDDNGIKIFNSSGEKISPDFEQKIEEIFYSVHNFVTGKINTAQTEPENFQNRDIYLDFLKEQAAHLKKEKLKIVVDCSHGAVYRIAPIVFKETTFEAHIMNTAPNGQNINRDCGSTNPEYLKKEVTDRKADMGIAFDGDGDRVIFADSGGNILEGDHTLYAISMYLQQAHQEFNNIVVGTIMGNLGLEKELNKIGIRYIRTPVGDYNVYLEMKKSDAWIGGEPSGHTILRTLSRTGDGILTAIYFLKSLFHLKLTAADIYNRLPLFPQITRNINIRGKKELESWVELNRMRASFNDNHGRNSRIVIRYSGTEPKIRVMIESEQRSVIENNLEKFENLIKSEIGG